MRRMFPILLASLAVNAVLAAILVHNHSSAPKLQSLESARTQTQSKLSATGRGERGEFVAVGGASQSDQTQSPFQWAQLESSDYKEYIERLHAFGVPEKTIRDIIMADVAKLYRPRFAALRPPKKPKNQNFWENRNFGYNPNGEMTKEQREQTRALQKEQSELIKTLLGKDVYEEMAKDSGYPDWTERTYGPLSKEEREKISDMQERFQDAQSEIYAKADGYVDQDTQAELATARRKFRDELATVLTPQQLQEYELRSSEVSQQMRWELSSFDPNEQEFRAVFAYKQALADLNPPRNPDDEPKRPSPEEMKVRQQKQKEMDEALAQALGPDRTKEYKLMEDYSYRNLFEAGVPKESVFKVADIKKDVEIAASKVRQDKTLTRDQQIEALKAIRAETEKTMTGLLGERRTKAYAANGGWWLRNLFPQSDQP